MGVATKILEVMKNVEYLRKDGEVKFGNTSYNFLSEENITSTIRDAMKEVGLVMIPVKTELMESSKIPTRSGESTKVIVKMTYKIIDVDTGESETIEMMGEGADSGDKAINKANTGAFKYAQRQAFMIPTGDDPDKISSAELTGDKTGGKSKGKIVGTDKGKINTKTMATISKLFKESQSAKTIFMMYMKDRDLPDNLSALNKISEQQGQEVLKIMEDEARGEVKKLQAS